MKIDPLHKTPTFGIAVAIIGFLGSSLAQANIVADFTGGSGTTSVDQYFGIAGNGWATPWQPNTNGTNVGTTFVGSVLNTNPLNGGGNYLSSTLTAGSGTGVGKGVEQRRYESLDNISLSTPHIITFDLRLDSALTTFTSTTDYLQAFDRPFDSDFGANGAWLIRATGASVNGITAQHWMLYNGGKNGGAFNNANFVDSGVPLVSGTVYHFQINVDPTLLQYTVSINGGALSAPMGFRSNTAANLGSLNFGGEVSNASEIMTYSLDSVAIVPEPATTGFCMAVGTLVLVGFHRRRRRRSAEIETLARS